MSLEIWKEALDWIALALIGLTVVIGAAALVLGKKINDKQSGEIRAFQTNLTASQTKLAEAQTKLSTVQLALKSAAARATTPRRIIMGNRDGDQELRAVKFKALEAYADTPTTIICVQDEEAETLAIDIRNVLVGIAKWKFVSITDRASAHLPLGLIQPGVQIRTLQRADGKNVVPAAPIPGTKPSPMAQALWEMLSLDLGPPVGSISGVTWQPDAIVNGRSIGALSAYGLKIPDNGVVITVGRIPTEELFFAIPDLIEPDKK